MAVSATYVGASVGLCARLVLTICAFTYHRALATSASTQMVVRRRTVPSSVWRTLENHSSDPSRRLCSPRRRQYFVHEVRAPGASRPQRREGLSPFEEPSRDSSTRTGRGDCRGCASTRSSGPTSHARPNDGPPVSPRRGSDPHILRDAITRYRRGGGRESPARYFSTQGFWRRPS